MEADIKNKDKICIYCIENTVNGKKYIGKTKCLYKRIHQYLYDYNTRRRKCINQYFLNSLIKYGINKFKYYTLEEFDELNDDLIKDRELFWIDKYQTTNSDNGYNLRRDSSTTMIVHQKTKNKISKRLKEEWKSGVRDDHSDKLKENWSDNTDRKKQQSKVMSKVLSRYLYKLYDINGNFIKDCKFKTLRELGLKNVLHKFHYHNTNECDFKGYKIKRIKIEDIVRTSEQSEKHT